MTPREEALREVDRELDAFGIDEAELAAVAERARQLSAEVADVETLLGTPDATGSAPAGSGPPVFDRHAEEDDAEEDDVEEDGVEEDDAEEVDEDSLELLVDEDAARWPTAPPSDEQRLSSHPPPPPLRPRGGGVPTAKGPGSADE